MSNPHDSADSHQDELQFDEAEFTEPAHALATCTACQSPIADLYYEAGGKIVCDPCRHNIEAMFHGGSRLGRALKALILGTIAAVAGAVVFYAVSKIAGGRGLGLVAIFSGLIIGGAVKAGSGNRGGWFYQLMAIFLTYSAVVAMFLPIALEQFQDKEKKNQAQFEEILNKARDKAEAEKKRNPDKAEAVAPNNKDAKQTVDMSGQTRAKLAGGVQAPKAAEPKVSKTPKPIAQPAMARDAPEPAGKPENREADPDLEEPEILNGNLNAGLSPAILILMVVAGIVAAYCLPIAVAFGSPIIGMMIAFALWEAWKMNRKFQLVINGPFHLAAEQPVDLAAEDLDDEQ